MPGSRCFQAARSHPQGAPAEAEQGERLDGGRPENLWRSASGGSSTAADIAAFSLQLLFRGPATGRRAPTRAAADRYR
jgi:hypothetical protein